MKYKISVKAQTDLINIWEYTYENWSLEQADRYIMILTDQFQEIAKNPNTGKNYEGLERDYRGFQIKSHVIFYEHMENEFVEIIRILHKRMDLENRLIK